jgi:tetratricopeptide (TPR) repeat protein
MVGKDKAHVRIDLNQFKLHINIKPNSELTLHFNSPSRRFYISVIALVVHEMKKRGKITSVSLQEHQGLLALQDKITQKIVGALVVKLTASEHELVSRKETDNLQAYDAFLKGWEHYRRWSPEDMRKAVSYLRKAVELDLQYNRAYAALALTYWEAGSLVGVNYFVGRLLARHYLEIAKQNPTSITHSIDSDMNLYRRRYEEALFQAERALALSPNGLESHVAMAHALIFSGRPKEALDIINRLMWLDPRNSGVPFRLRGITLFSMGQYEEAATSFERVLTHIPEGSWVDLFLAAAYAHLGRKKEARTTFEHHKVEYFKAVGGGQWKIQKLHLAAEMYHLPFKDPHVADRFVEGFIKAGYPEPHTYYTVSKENKLTGDELQKLPFGYRQIGICAGEQWSVDTFNDGSCIFTGYGLTDKGKTWVEGGTLCNRYKILHEGLIDCGDVYRNPEGTAEAMDKYIIVKDFGIYPFSYVDLKY